MSNFSDIRNLQVSELITFTRNILDSNSLDRPQLALIRQKLENLASKTELWTVPEFSAPEGTELQSRYFIKGEANEGISLYLNVMRTGKKIPPHDHTTWACVAAVEGSEHNTLYKRTDDMQVEGKATIEESELVEICPGNAVAMMPDDIHSVEIRGEQTIRHLHFYGKPLETLNRRKAFNMKNGTYRIMDIGVKTQQATSTKFILAADLKPLLADGKEIAFLDIREHGQYGEGHPFFCVNAPYSVLEKRVPYLVPSLHTRCFLMDNNDGVAQKAAKILKDIGYQNIKVLKDGVQGWTAAGFNLFKGVNVLSKTFGELVEHENATPSISAQELKAMIDDDTQPLLILDGRPANEYNKMSIPTAISCPNAELAYRLPMMLDSDTTPIVVNCAGRTRSIIGAQSMRNTDILNPIFALRDGTQGWRIAGFELNHGSLPETLVDLSQTAYDNAKLQAIKLQQRYGLNSITQETLLNWQKDTKRTTFLIDIRTIEEFEQAHIAGARHAAGGQLVQATDEYIGVRGARIILSDDAQLRATNTAIWLKGMGHEVYILDVDARSGVSKKEPENSISIHKSIDIKNIKELLKQGAVLFDASRGMQYRTSHIADAKWITRSRLASVGDIKDHDVIIVGRQDAILSGIELELKSLGINKAHIWLSTPQDWKQAGFTIVASPSSPTEEECIDHLFFVHDRHDGNLDAARRYLEWEKGLMAQLDDQERSSICPLSPQIGA